MVFLTEPDGKIRLAALYQAKLLRKILNSELKVRSAQILFTYLEYDILYTCISSSV